MNVRHMTGHLLAMLLTVLLPLGLATSSALAQDREIMRDKMIQWGDYDQFQIAGPGGARSCAETCANDPRCRAWTFVRPVNQCRLKHDIGPVVDNACCLSGIKPEGDVGETGGKPAFCADYARSAVAANAQNLSQGCQLQGPQWSDDFQGHYSWCMGARRDEATAGIETRKGALAQCEQSASQDSTAKCDHFARVSAVQMETAHKAHCALPDGDRRWAGDMEAQRRVCLSAPARVLETQIAEREAVLATCLAAAGQAHEACDGYADKAIEQVRGAMAAGCEVSGARWSTSRGQQQQWCLSADPDARRAETDARARQLAQCTQQADRRRLCDQYADAAVAQALRNANANCGFDGPVWSRYKDEHVAFCMDAGDAQIRKASADRDAALQQCQGRAEVNPECDEYAKRVVRFGQINDERQCGYDGELWQTDYRAQYDFCLRSNPVDRRASMIRRREALQACSIDHGFKLELGF